MMPDQSVRSIGPKGWRVRRIRCRPLPSRPEKRIIAEYSSSAASSSARIDSSRNGASSVSVGMCSVGGGSFEPNLSTAVRIGGKTRHPASRVSSRGAAGGYRGSEIEPIVVHHLDPRLDEAGPELVLRVVGGA